MPTPQSVPENVLNTRQSIYASTYDRKHALKNVLTKIEILDEHANVESLQTLETVFKEADEIHNDITIEEKVINQDEVVLDSKVMSLSSKVIKTCGQTLTKECIDFSSYQFAEKILCYVQHLPDTTLNELNWDILARELPLLQTTANFTCLLNNLNRTKKKSKQQLKMEKILALKTSQNAEAKPKQRLNPNVARKKPENVVNLDKEEKSDKILKTIKRIIRENYLSQGRQPVNYFRLVIDPHDFGKTIENMFHVSFLCRNGSIKTFTDDEMNLVILPLKEKNPMENVLANIPQYQNITHMDMETWKFLKDALRITEAMISNDDLDQ